MAFRLVTKKLNCSLVGVVELVPAAPVPGLLCGPVFALPAMLDVPPLLVVPLLVVVPAVAVPLVPML
jgi:hypothetical protein